MVLFGLFKIFFMIGAFSFGGGVAMIPIIEREVVEKRKWLDEAEFLDALTIAQSCPGVLAANISIYTGYKIKGIAGALSCLLGAISPAFIILVLVSKYFYAVRTNPLTEKIFIGVRPAVCAIIIVGILNISKKMNLKIHHYIVASLVCFGISYMNISAVWFIIAGAIFGLLHYTKKN